jgi:hypothetical protein
MQLPKTIMFKDIKIIDCNQSYIIKEYCSYCDELAIKTITRTSILTDKTQAIHVCKTCLKTEVKGIKKYMRREAD